MLAVVNHLGIVHGLMLFFSNAQSRVAEQLAEARDEAESANRAKSRFLSTMVKPCSPCGSVLTVLLSL